MNDATSPAGPDAVPPPAQPLAGVRILAVDDAVDALESLSMLLQLEGAAVTAVPSAAAALVAVGQARFDLVLSDVSMPGMDGYALMGALRALRETARLPAIALTGFGRPQDVRRALDAGFDTHLEKPIRIDRLLQTVACLLRPSDAFVR